MVSKHYKSAAEISDLGKVQIARACGVAIVTNGNMYPTMELLLRHAIQCAFHSLHRPSLHALRQAYGLTASLVQVPRNRWKEAGDRARCARQC